MSKNTQHSSMLNVMGGMFASLAMLYIAQKNEMGLAGTAMLLFGALTARLIFNGSDESVVNKGSLAYTGGVLASVVAFAQVQQAMNMQP